MRAIIIKSGTTYRGRKYIHDVVVSVPEESALQMVAQGTAHHIGVTCAECVGPIDVSTMEDCIECPECGFTYCDNCYDTTKGDGCHCHEQ